MATRLKAGRLALLTAAVAQAAQPVQVHRLEAAYPGPCHGFDGHAKRGLRSEGHRGNNPRSQGVRVGADPRPRATAALRLERLIHQNWSRP